MRELYAPCLGGILDGSRPSLLAPGIPRGMVGLEEIASSYTLRALSGVNPKSGDQEYRWFYVSDALSRQECEAKRLVAWEQASIVNLS